MADIIDYIHWRGDLSFMESPLNNIDNIVFSRFSYLQLDGIVPEGVDADITIAEAAERFFANPEYEKLLVLGRDAELLREMAASRRFGSLRLLGYTSTIDKNREEQAAAVVIQLYKGLYYLAFRGTDNTLVGWKEDLNMCFIYPVPAQETAAEFLNRTANALHGKFYVGGHSKGGNMAVYSAVKSSAAFKRSLIAVFNNDGPGFNGGFLNSEEYLSIKDKIKTFLPQSSVVGMMLEHEENYSVVKSTQKGILQHDPFSWQVQGADFVYKDEIAESSKVFSENLKKWLGGLSYEERTDVVDAIYSVLTETEVEFVTELAQNWQKKAIKALFAYGNLSPEQRKMLNEFVSVVATLMK